VHRWLTSSNVITLDAAAGEPTQGNGEGDNGSNYGIAGHGMTGDQFDNLTVDFGFYKADFGDVPDSYGTTFASSGASHILDGITFLGSSVDSELDGQPSANADGDDVLSGAWIDFNGNGTFDAGEQIASDQPLAAGTNTLSLTAPANVDDDNLYSRFRFTADAGDVTGPDGQATTGEVEDYVLMSLGNTIWLDDGAGAGSANADNGIQDGTEAGIPNVIVELIDDNGAVVATTTTNSNGEYLFTGLVPGDYTVHLPASNFGPGQPLVDMTSTSDTGNSGNVDPDTDEDDQDGDENGVDDADPAANGISSQAITLEYGAEPQGDGNGANSNLTVDFGLVYYDVALIKTRSAGQTYAADFSTTPPTMRFDITVENQGPATVYNRC